MIVSNMVYQYSSELMKIVASITYADSDSGKTNDRVLFCQYCISQGRQHVQYIPSDERFIDGDCAESWDRCLKNYTNNVLKTGNISKNHQAHEYPFPVINIICGLFSNLQHRYNGNIFSCYPQWATQKNPKIQALAEHWRACWQKRLNVLKCNTEELMISHHYRLYWYVDRDATNIGQREYWWIDNLKSGIWRMQKNTVHYWLSDWQCQGQRRRLYFIRVTITTPAYSFKATFLLFNLSVARTLTIIKWTNQSQLALGSSPIS